MVWPDRSVAPLSFEIFPAVRLWLFIWAGISAPDPININPLPDLLVTATDTDKQELIDNILVVLAVGAGVEIEHGAGFGNGSSLQCLLVHLEDLIEFPLVGVVESQHNCIILVPEHGGSDGHVHEVDPRPPVHAVELVCGKWHCPGLRDISALLDNNHWLQAEICVGLR